MKTNLFLFLSLVLAGCQTTPPVVRPLPDLPPLRGKAGHYADHAPRDDALASPATPGAAPGERAAQQARVIEALIAQNDALSARLHAAEHEAASMPAPSSPAALPALTTAPATPPTPLPATSSAGSGLAAAVLLPIATDLPLLAPNADGAIDATALAATASDSLPNPFAVRVATAEPAREITLDVQGIVAGTQPCALVNGHVVEPGDIVESLRLAHLGTDSVVLNGDGFALNLPFGATKVRLPL